MEVGAIFTSASVCSRTLNYISNNFSNTFRKTNVIFNSLKLILNDGFGEETNIPIRAHWL